MEQNTNMPIKQDDSYQQLINSIATLMESARTHIALEVNTTMVDTYWHIGQYIVEFEQHGNSRADYGKNVLKRLSKRLTEKYGEGWSDANLRSMRQFYSVYSKMLTSGQQIDKKQTSLRENSEFANQWSANSSNFSVKKESLFCHGLIIKY